MIVGSSFAKSLAQALSIPMTDVDHMKAHIHSIFLKNEVNSYPKFPFLSLTVSGGHTQLVVVNDYNDLKKLVIHLMMLLVKHLIKHPNF